MRAVLSTRFLVAGALLLPGLPTMARAQDAPLKGELVVFNAGSLGLPFRNLLKAFKRRIAKSTMLVLVVPQFGRLEAI